MRRMRRGLHDIIIKTSTAAAAAEEEVRVRVKLTGAVVAGGRIGAFRGFKTGDGATRGDRRTRVEGFSAAGRVREVHKYIRRYYLNVYKGFYPQPIPCRR